MRRITLFVAVLLFIVACGGSSSPDATATATRAVNLAQLATAQAPTATTIPPTDTSTPNLTAVATNTAIPANTPTPKPTNTPRPTATVAAPTATTSTESAGDAFLRIIDYSIKGQWVRRWEALHPAEQAVVPESLYVDCASRNPFDISNVGIVETYHEVFSVPEVGAVPTTAITWSFDF